MCSVYSVCFVLFFLAKLILNFTWLFWQILLSSSMDKTVRMWRIGCTQSLRVFRHNDYGVCVCVYESELLLCLCFRVMWNCNLCLYVAVTCIQFNPVDGNYFISGSIDGKVRVWGVHEERVVDWADIRDVITAISYKPDGKV